MHAVLKHPIIRSIVWLAILAPFFFWSYGWANHYAANLPTVPSIQFSWESNIPFIPWMILPYWSIDLLYGLAFLTCKEKQSVDRYALRLLTSQIISVVCFIVFPLRCLWIKPEVTGTWGAWFAQLMAFDLPYNQAPSLHISLLVIIWSQFATRLRGLSWAVFSCWMVLIAISVLTTYQHHFLDIPTGVLVGLFALWCWPTTLAHHSPIFSNAKRTVVRNSWKLASGYFLGAILCLGSLLLLGWMEGFGILLLWISISLLMVSACYAMRRPDWYQKMDGCQSVAAYYLLLPYQLAAKFNAAFWTRKIEVAHEIVPNVYLGRWLSRKAWQNWRHQHSHAIRFDLCPELSDFPYSVEKRAGNFISIAFLDLLAPTTEQLALAVRTLDKLYAAPNSPKIYVCCALGFSRSALVLAAWLIYSGKASSVEEAITLIQQRRTCIVISPSGIVALTRFKESVKND